jgi:dihydrodipicolinate reductase
VLGAHPHEGGVTIRALKPLAESVVVRHGDGTAYPLEHVHEGVWEGEVPGTHVVRYTSEADTLTLTHEAHSRRGLAEGALIAAEWLLTAPAGVYNMQDVLGV